MIHTTCLLVLAAASFASGDAVTSPGPNEVSSVATTFSSPVVERRAAPEGKEKFEAVEFKTRDKQTIHASFYAPRKSGRAPAALLIHDAGCDSEMLTGIAETLQRKGFAVLIPDLRGHGASVTDNCNWAMAKDETEKMNTWTFAMRDLEASTEYLRGLSNVHNSNLSLVGVGAGAVLAARYAVRDENARSVVLIAPKAEVYGFNILKDINDLGGLPVMIMSESDGRKEATRIQKASTQCNDGVPYVELMTLKPKKGEGVFSDRRLGAELTKFLAKEAMPKR